MADVVGLVPGEPADDGALTWRDDDRAQRLVVQPGPANDAVAVGFEAVDAAALRRSRRPAPRDRGRRRPRAPTTTSRRDASTAWCARRRRGASTSSSCSGSPTPATPYSSPLVPGGFLTDGVGFGHVVFATTAFDESVRFLTDGPRARAVRLARDRAGPGIDLEVRFFHCNARHHTVALARAPFELPQCLHHVMFEANSRDDVGAAFDRAWDAELPIPNGLGRHDNDGMFSFYLQTPAGFQIEFGHGARVVGDDWDDNRRYDRISAWGHQPLQRGHEHVPSRRRSTATSPSSAPGPSGLVLAVLLAQLGRSVVVLEQWPAPYALPRAVHFDDEVGRLLQSCGIGDELRGVSEPAEVYEWRNAAGTTLLRFGRIGTGASGWPFSSMFCQPELEALLDARARARCRRSRSGAASRSTRSSSDDGTVVRRLQRRRPESVPATSSAATAPTRRCARCSTSASTTAGSSTTG